MLYDLQRAQSTLGVSAERIRQLRKQLKLEHGLHFIVFGRSVAYTEEGIEQMRRRNRKPTGRPPKITAVKKKQKYNPFIKLAKERVIAYTPGQQVAAHTQIQVAMPFASVVRGNYAIYNMDCLTWLTTRESESIHAVVTDPPYGLKEYTTDEQRKLRNGKGGVWRIPPNLNGYSRAPLPRFTVLDSNEREQLRSFFYEWGKLVWRILVPGGHIIIATNPLVSHILYSALEHAGFEKRGEIIRLVQTLRGGDRPKNAHEEFPCVSVMPRSAWEPWGLFRKPCEGRVQDNLRKWKTGGLRRISDAQPFSDVIKSSPTQARERKIAPHPSLKPQGFMRQIVRAALPLGEGVVVDPFMGSGATVAAACAIGYDAIGIEKEKDFFLIAAQSIPLLANLPVGSSK